MWLKAVVQKSMNASVVSIRFFANQYLSAAAATSATRGEKRVREKNVRVLVVSVVSMAPQRENRKPH